MKDKPVTLLLGAAAVRAGNARFGWFYGTCAFVGDSAVLNTTDGDSNPNNAYAGVYLQKHQPGRSPPHQVHNLGFSYAGVGAAGGSPRLSIPIDEDGDGTKVAPRLMPRCLGAPSDRRRGENDLVFLCRLDDAPTLWPLQAISGPWEQAPAK